MTLSLLTGTLSHNQTKPKLLFIPATQNKTESSESSTGDGSKDSKSEESKTEDKKVRLVARHHSDSSHNCSYHIPITL